MTFIRSFPFNLILAAMALASALLPTAVQAQVPPAQIPPALTAAITTDQQAAAARTGGVYVGDCSAPSPPNTPGRCSTVAAIQAGYAKVIIGRVGAEGVGTYLYQLSGSTWNNLGLIADNAPFPPTTPPGPPATGTGSIGDSSSATWELPLVASALGAIALGGLWVIRRRPSATG